MRNIFHREEEGQILLWVALVAGLLIIFTAMAVDMGNIYYHKARLSNAVDAAVLTGVKLYGSIDGSGNQITQARAQQYADDVFAANYGSDCGVNGLTCTWLWCPIDVVGCPQGNQLSLQLHVTQAPVNTSFMAYWPQWAQWHLGDIGAATRSVLVMSLVLDRSGSMDTLANGGDGGGPALQSAVPNFVADFIQGTDYISMISFSSDARVDVPITQNFVMPVDTAVAAFTWDGGTFGTGGGTNPCPLATLNCPPTSLADNQNTIGATDAGTSNPIFRAVIYFTDGLMNTIQDNFQCTNNPPGPTLYNYGGYDSGLPFHFFIPTGELPGHGSQRIWPNYDYSYYYSGSGGGSGVGCTSTNGNGLCNGDPPFNSSVSCKGITMFPSQQSGTQVAFSRANITAEAQYRGITTANAMRQETPYPTYFYVIGLGNGVSGSLSTEQFLNTLANDPTGPGLYSCGTGAYPPATNCYNGNLPAGLFVVVPDCPSTNCTNELNLAFQKIASAIRLRLSR